MTPGQEVINTAEIRTALATIPPGTIGIVAFSERGVARVQFAGHIVVSQVPCAWLRPVRLAVVEPQEVEA